MKHLLTAVLLGLVLSGCAPTQRLDVHTRDAFDRVNQRLNGQRAMIHMLDEARIPARQLRVHPDSTYWTAQGTNQSRVVATQEIHAIEAAVFRTPLLSTKAFGLGFTGGYVLMAAASLSRQEPARISGEQALLTLGTGFVTGMLGAILFDRGPDAHRTTGRFILNARRSHARAVELAE